MINVPRLTKHRVGRKVNIGIFLHKMFVRKSSCITQVEKCCVINHILENDVHKLAVLNYDSECYPLIQTFSKPIVIFLYIYFKE